MRAGGPPVIPAKAGTSGRRVSAPSEEAERGPGFRRDDGGRHAPSPAGECGVTPEGRAVGGRGGRLGAIRGLTDGLCAWVLANGRRSPLRGCPARSSSPVAEIGPGLAGWSRCPVDAARRMEPRAPAPSPRSLSASRGSGPEMLQGAGNVRTADRPLRALGAWPQMGKMRTAQALVASAPARLAARW